MLNIRSILYKDKTAVQEFELSVFPCGYVVPGNKKLEQWLEERAKEFPVLKGDITGGERPEDYCYFKAAISNFELGDGYRVSYPNREYVSLYPYDNGFHHIIQLKE